MRKYRGMSVRKVIAILLTLVFCAMTLRGDITSDQMIPIYTMILGFYYGKSTALDGPGKHDTKTDIVKGDWE